MHRTPLRARLRIDPADLSLQSSGRNSSPWRRAVIISLVPLAILTGCGSEPDAEPAAPRPAAEEGHGGGEQGHGAADKLGTVDFKVSCNPAAQAEFNRGAALLHSFAFARAIESFNKVVSLDNSCAMGHWGVAMSLLGNPFGWPLTGPALADGAAAVARAVAAGPRTPREQAYVTAIDTFYRDAGTVAHQQRALAYAAAMDRLAQAHQDDTEAKIFYALALVATASPTDKTFANQLKAAEILEAAYGEQPDHPGVSHYLIHTFDHPPIADRGQAAARRYAKIAPSVSHALHMPSHIFTRLGEWQDSIGSNSASAEAAKDELSATHQQGAGSYNALHALDYLMYANLQLAKDDAARKVMDDIRAIDKLDVENFAAAYAFAAIPARYALERGQWAEAGELTLHPANLAWQRFPQAEAASVYARGLGAARSGDLAGATQAVERLQALRQALLAARQDYWAGQADIQSRVVGGWVALAQGEKDKALTLMVGAADSEAATDKHPVMPGPIAPARELLGEMRLALDQPAEALREFEASQRVDRNRFRTLYLTGVAAKRIGDRERAASAFRALLALAADAKAERPELAEAKAFLADTKS